MAARAVRRKPPERLYQMRGVRLFASGTYRGEDWAPAVIDEIASNAAELGPRGLGLLVPPSVLGHDEDQNRLAEFLESTDLPAAGWVDPNSVRAVDDADHPGHRVLVGDVVNIPEKVAAELKRGTYKFGSAEIYDDFRDDFGARHGRVLRRFALLGGEVPQVKRLGSLPPVEPMARPLAFSERARAIRVRAQLTNGRTHYYAETVMDRNAMIAAITAAMPGIAQATLETMSEEQLADLIKNLPGAGGMATPSGPAGPSAPPVMQPNAMFADDEPPAEPAPAEGADDGEPDVEEMREALVDWGQDPAEVDAMGDDEVMAMYDEMAAAMGPEGAAQPTADMDDSAAMDATVATPAGVPPGAMAREDMIAELIAAGQDAAALEAMGDDEIAQLYAQIGSAPQSAPQPAAAMSDRRNPRSGPVSTTRRGAKPAARRQAAAAFTERDARRLANNARQLNTVVESELARLRRQAMKAKRQAAIEFCDKLVRGGQFTKAQADSVVFPFLLSLDNTHAIHRYSENGVTKSGTAFERKTAELAAGNPVIAFGERAAGPKLIGPAADAHEVNIVRRFAETVPDATLRASNTTRENMVRDFETLRKKNPNLTAAQYIGAPAAESVRR